MTEVATDIRVVVVKLRTSDTHKQDGYYALTALAASAIYHMANHDLGFKCGVEILVMKIGLLHSTPMGEMYRTLYIEFALHKELKAQPVFELHEMLRVGLISLTDIYD